MESRNEKRMMAAACQYAYSRFVLNFYMFYETMGEGRYVSDEQKELQKSFLELTGLFSQGEYPLEELDRLRSRIIREVDLITAYVDRFQIYEYVLNRMEGRFADMDDLKLVDDEAFADEVMGFIMAQRDTAVVNSRIKMILEQLPIRFTKAKFFSIVSQSLSVYEGTDKKSLEQMLTVLRSEAMLDKPAEDEGHKELKDLLAKLAGGDHKNPTRESYREMRDAFSIARERLTDASYACMLLMDLVNDLYVVCLTRSDTLMDSQEEELFKTIVGKVQKRAEHALSVGPEESLKDLETIEAMEDMDALLVQMEGKQEHYHGQWARYEMTDPGKDMDKDTDGGDERSLRIRKVERLLSTSSFMDLKEEEEPEPEGILLSRKAVEEMCQPFLQELEASWKSMPKMLVRAVMAKLLSFLPMFFTTLDEIRQFILGCLTSCTDLAEKTICVDLIRQIMESEDAVV